MIVASLPTVVILLPPCMVTVVPEIVPVLPSIVVMAEPEPPVAKIGDIPEPRDVRTCPAVPTTVVFNNVPS